MTRDEAIKIVNKAIDDSKRGSAGCAGAINVDMLVSLGLLKLDEPKSMDARLQEALVMNGFVYTSVHDYKRVIDKAGLKIVEK